MYRVIGLLLLAGCAAGPGTVAGFRKPETPIYSSAVLENGRLRGDWVQVAEFAAPDAPACEKGRARISNGSKLEAQLCLNGVKTRISGQMVAVGPGRFETAGGEVWWVLWADSGYRTLAIGTPSGRFGFVLNRGGDIPADRMKAAREVLAWNGYAVGRMR